MVMIGAIGANGSIGLYVMRSMLCVVVWRCGRDVRCW